SPSWRLSIYPGKAIPLAGWCVHPLAHPTPKRSRLHDQISKWETEWVETLACNCNVLTGADCGRILQAVAEAPQVGPWKMNYGRGDAGSAILNALAAHVRTQL
ncbi:MAG TPA: hypothetical protein VIX14_04755, partial [Terriglobales bacterium]